MSSIKMRYKNVRIKSQTSGHKLNTLLHLLLLTELKIKSRLLPQKQLDRHLKWVEFSNKISMKWKIEFSIFAGIRNNKEYHASTQIVSQFLIAIIYGTYEKLIYEWFAIFLVISETDTQFIILFYSCAYFRYFFRISVFPLLCYTIMLQYVIARFLLWNVAKQPKSSINVQIMQLKMLIEWHSAVFRT